MICDALNYFHEKKHIHRDVKSSNILLKHGEIKLCDMGQAKQLKMAQINLSNIQGFSTKIYLPPEVLNNQAYNEKVVSGQQVWFFIRC